MATVASAGQSSLDSRKRPGRAINAVADLLRRKLAVPHIFLKPTAKLLHPDVLAVDRAGSGDLHAVEIELEASPEVSVARNPGPADIDILHKDWYLVHVTGMVKQFRDQLMATPANYRYLAIREENCALFIGALAGLGLYAPDGIGRLGVMAIRERGEDLPEADIVVAPERFRIESQKMVAIEKFLAKAKPGMEVRI
jgi:hypothetical protein